MLIHDLDIAGVAILPNKAASPLIVDPNAVLSFPVAPQLLETIPGRRGEIAKFGRSVQLAKLSLSNSFNCPIPFDPPPCVKQRRVLRPE